MKRHFLIILMAFTLPVFANAEVLIQGNVDWGIGGIDGIIFPMPFDHEILVMYEFPEIGRFSIAAGGGVIFPYTVLPALATDLGFKLFETENYDFSIHWALTGGMDLFPVAFKYDDGTEVLRYDRMYGNTALLVSWHWPESKLYVQTGPSFGVFHRASMYSGDSYMYFYGIRSVFGIRL